MRKASSAVLKRVRAGAIGRPARWVPWSVVRLAQAWAVWSAVFAAWSARPAAIGTVITAGITITGAIIKNLDISENAETIGLRVFF